MEKFSARDYEASDMTKSKQMTNWTVPTKQTCFSTQKLLEMKLLYR